MVAVFGEIHQESMDKDEEQYRTKSGKWYKISSGKTTGLKKVYYNNCSQTFTLYANNRKQQWLKLVLIEGRI